MRASPGPGHDQQPGRRHRCPQSPRPPDCARRRPRRFPVPRRAGARPPCRAARRCRGASARRCAGWPGRSARGRGRPLARRAFVRPCPPVPLRRCALRAASAGQLPSLALRGVLDRDARFGELVADRVGRRPTPSRAGLRRGVRARRRPDARRRLADCRRRRTATGRRDRARASSACAGRGRIRARGQRRRSRRRPPRAPRRARAGWRGRRSWRRRERLPLWIVVP